VRPLVNDWNLQVRDTRSDDNGQYRCTVNTSPVTSKVVSLNVKGTCSHTGNLLVTLIINNLSPSLLGICHSHY